MGLRKAGCEERRRVELAEDRVQWRTPVLALSNLQSFTTRELIKLFCVCITSLQIFCPTYPTN
jgi:hypothetical protein